MAEEKVTLKRDSILYRTVSQSRVTGIAGMAGLCSFIAFGFTLLIVLASRSPQSTGVHGPMAPLIAAVICVTVGFNLFAGLSILNLGNEPITIDLRKIDPDDTLTVDSWKHLGVNFPVVTPEDHIRYWQQQINKQERAA